MQLAWFHFYQFGIFQSGGPVTYFMVIAYGNRVVRIESYYLSVLHEYTGDTIYSGRDDVFIIEADILSIGLYPAVEVGAALRA